ncbi:natural resistance-associated macrophage protein [Thelephora ganbajun]|uniref:Natural resistance-associated macrophage protein n=1 Tax=Thelephora ganbajun TaxID=370292 RepID=A0ACB6ZKN3_THEGA|nr:natural resistance-associated macrophage protein [Thelephora ganbajun]
MSDPPQVEAEQSKWQLKKKLSKAYDVVTLHLSKHSGVGFVCAVAYFDPGNWGVDLQAGSEYGYKLLFVVLLSGVFAVLLQSLASKLGCVTGTDLASHCRLLFYNRPRHTLLYRWLVLYPLYVLAEIAIISTDLSELLGSAMGLIMLFPKLPLWAGVLITACDVFVILLVGDPLRRQPVKLFEWLIAAMVFSILVCMLVIITKIEVDWGQAFFGFVPSKKIFQAGGLYTSIGIIGATVMPHGLFIGSALATQDRLSPAPLKDDNTSDAILRSLPEERKPIGILNQIRSSLSEAFRNKAFNDHKNRPQRYEDRENNSYWFVKSHIYHGVVDIVLSLLGVAVTINSMILIVASAVFYYGEGRSRSDSQNPASLFDAHDLLSKYVGKPAGVLFAVALLFSGQSSTIIATVAGQVVSEGFLNWSISPFLRRVLTRLLSLIPAMAVALALGRAGIDQLLVASQVALSIILPFIMLPLLWLTTNKEIMSVKRPESDLPALTADGSPSNPDISPASKFATPKIGSSTERDVEASPPPITEMVDYSNGKIIAGIGYLTWIVVIVANAYVIVMLAMGKSG